MIERKVFLKGARLILSSNKIVIATLLAWILAGSGIAYGDRIQLQSSGDRVVIKVPGGKSFLEPVWKCSPETGEMFITFRRQALAESVCRAEKIYSEESSMMVTTSVRDSFYVNLKILTLPYQKANLYYDLSERTYVVEIVRQGKIFPVSEAVAVLHSPEVDRSSVFVANIKMVSRTMFLFSVVVLVVGMVYVLSRRIGKLTVGLGRNFPASKKLSRSRKGGVESSGETLKKEKKTEKGGEELSYDELKILMKLKNRKIDVRA